MRRMTLIGVGVAIGLALGIVGEDYARAQQPQMKRKEILTTELRGGQEAHMWVADIPPGAATGSHRHPTPRFVYVMEGSVTVEMQGKPPQEFTAGQAFAESPDTLHNFKNASTTVPAKALGFQIAGKGQSLQY